MTSTSAEPRTLAANQRPLWRWDTKALIGSALLGVVMTLLNQVMDRVDTALTGGAFLLFGAVVYYTIASLSTLFFRLPGGIITGWVQALIATATGASPIAIMFWPVNLVYAVVYAVVMMRLPMNRWHHHLFAILPSVLISMLGILYGLVSILKLPVNIAVVSYALTGLSGIIGATILTPWLSRSIDRSGVMN